MSGTYVGPTHQVSNLVAWKTFEADYDLNGGSAIFYIKHGSSEALCLADTWTVVVPGQSLSFIGTDTWLQVKAELSANTTAIDSAAKLRSYTIYWSNMSGSVVPITEIVGFTDQDRYWLAGAESPDKFSDTALILDKRNNFQVARDFKIGAYAPFNRRSWFGSSVDHSIFILDTVYSHDDRDYESYVVFGEFELSKRDQLKQLMEIWVDLQGEAGGTLHIDIYNYADAVWVALEDADLTGNGTLSFRKSINQYGQGKLFKFRIRMDQKNEKFILDRIALVFQASERAEDMQNLYNSFGLQNEIAEARIRDTFQRI
jgi:hypothetical protein